jgi:general secretion pathway protein K
VPGFTPEMLDKLKDFVIFLPHFTLVNVNTASAEVLSARIDGLALGDATTLVAQRSTASFRDITDFTNRLGRRPLTPLDSTASVMTNYFLINGKVRMSRAELEMQALIERNVTTTKLIWIREY